MCGAIKKPGHINANEMEIEILADGRVKITTGNMGGVYHTTADNFVKFVSELMGGEVTVEKNKGGHQHHHHHGTEHTHQ